MPCPHNEISIVQRSHRQSAVAAAAYQSGEKLFCEYDQLPFCGLAIWEHLALQAVPSRQV